MSVQDRVKRYKSTGGGLGLVRVEVLVPIEDREEAWIQVSSATVDLKAASSSAMASSGVFHPRVLRGRWFISRATSFSSV